jgi:hypothetical protein
MPTVVLAFDRQSARSFDADGRMRVKNCILSTAEVNPYRGAEIPGWRDLGLDPQRVYDLYRHPDELARAAATFEGVPLMIKHIPQTAEQPRQEYQCGSVHTITFDGKHLRGDLLVSDGRAIELIESGTLADLSCGYRYKPVMRSGEADGTTHDGIMRDIEGNHVALVDDGRASGAHVADSAFRQPVSPETTPQGDKAMPFEDQEEPQAGGQTTAGANGTVAPGSPQGEQNEEVNMAAIGQAMKHIAEMLGHIHQAVVKPAAQPGDTAAVDGTQGEGVQPSGTPEGAQDFELELGAQGTGAGEGGAGHEGAMDEDELETSGSGQEGTPARGNPTPHGAMDAKSVRTLVAAAAKRERESMRALAEAAREVRGVLGDVDVFAFDSAGAVYREALGAVGVDVAAIGKGAEKTAWQAFRVATATAAGARMPGAATHAMDGRGAVANETASRLAALANKISVKG